MRRSRFKKLEFYWLEVLNYQVAILYTDRHGEGLAFPTSEALDSKSVSLYDPCICGVRSQYPKTGPRSIGFWNWAFIPVPSSPYKCPHLLKNAFLGIVSANNCFSNINPNAYAFSTIKNLWELRQEKES